MKTTSHRLLAICSLFFLTSQVIGQTILLPETAYPSTTLDIDETQPQTFTNSFNIYSENEIIGMELPHSPSTETHYLSSEKASHTISLSYQDDTVYVLSIQKKDEDTSELNNENMIAEDLIISGYPAQHTCNDLDDTAAKEFLYGWTGTTFADELLDKGMALQLHMIELESANHNILLSICGPNNPSLEAIALQYAHSLEIVEPFQLFDETK